MRGDLTNGYDPRDPRDPQSAPRWPGGAPPQWPTTPIHPSAAGNTTPLPPRVAVEVVPSTPATPATPARRRSFVGDVGAGLFLGDFASDLGLPGATTQVVVSFVPLVGSICALRDLTADLRHHDHVGAALNFLALTPFLGGFSKTFEVIRNTAHVGHAMHVSAQQLQRRRDENEPGAR